MNKRLFFFIIFLLPVFASAQEMRGISNSNFAGNMGMGLNPATMVAAPYSFEVNIISGDIFVQNNYIYMRKNSLQTADYYTRPDKNGYLSLNIKGPSVIINRGNFAFGFHTAIRAGLSAKNVPYHFAKFSFDGFDFAPQHGINYTSDPFKVAFLSWIETGLSFGARIKETQSNLLTGAITVNYLQGLGATFIDIVSMDYIVPSADLLVVNNINGSYGHTPFDNTGNIPAQALAVNGRGFSADIGFNLIHNRLERAFVCGKRSNNFKKYSYKIGFSLVDFGNVKLSNSTIYSFNNASMQWPGIDTVKFQNLADFDSSLSNRFFNDPNSSLTGKGFTVNLPTAVSLQFDYCLLPRWYVNATLIHRVPFGKIRLERPNQVSITPRYETRAFEVALPVSLYDFTSPRIGLAFRYRFFVLGTDKIGALTRIWDSTGMDLFFGIKISFCSNNVKRKRSDDCYSF